MQLAVTVLLSLAVAAVWLASLAFLRLKTPMDRLHCASFVTLTAGAFVLAAVAAQDGLSPRTFKTLFLLVAAACVSAASAHAVGRALQLRDAEER